ncbi:2-amino-4-hydroxy-6-hydroxymethyldihydropteridine diphosphokinase [Candidatus Enterovibrio escicola]|uniref:2-amino-4-hydroxy-6- hydroxymethyldihydropteridine diphosphokinase n=1 Tax=Candidatus Enterovibrio escicola TaxID=1927127 RepID=UPI001238007E|nr:2-amino-4-hydroxy-6-hydroxymethyldihydropteridine diphosphokinase [Candidatus Enterovibrio escacola]
MTQVLVSVGSNIDREFHIVEGISALRELNPNCHCSRIFDAEPVGFEGPNFYNLVVEFQTDLTLTNMVVALRNIESRWGRKRDSEKSQDRTLDIDLLTYGESVRLQDPTLPRNDVYKFAFTLWPLTELCPEQVIPGDLQTYAQAWSTFNKNQALWPVFDFYL